jgi:hypothetical protein
MPTDTDWLPAGHPDGRDTDPAWPPTGPPPVGRGPLQDLRWQRRMRPRWQRIAFVSVLVVLFALLFDPSRVLFAGLGLAIATILWPVLGWPGCIITWTLADGWTAALVGWQHTIRYPDHQRVSVIWAVGACASTVPVSPGRRPVPASRFPAVCPVRPGLTSTSRAFRVSGPLPATTSAPIWVTTRAARLRAAFLSRSSTSPQRSHR